MANMHIAPWEFWIPQSFLFLLFLIILINTNKICEIIVNTIYLVFSKPFNILWDFFFSL
jgi:hypothetical protein